MIINIKGSEGSLATAAGGNTFFNATCVKIDVAGTTGVDRAVIEIYVNDSFYANTSLIPRSEPYFIQKDPTDDIRLVAVNSPTVTATPVGLTIS